MQLTVHVTLEVIVIITEVMENYEDLHFIQGAYYIYNIWFTAALAKIFIFIHFPSF